ncbi:hypothetical protein EEL32_00030 (plasmid) [Brevibacillus laterosporus]|nr:hypothetical protein [Brevibacillus laterosporus]TPG65780.1 hypothetical protein EEL31_25380 [Brevibacillus laterosporus]TPG93789.1 hypothetical protein EEL32_00030 [Brevibacillus laterosporus]
MRKKLAIGVITAMVATSMTTSVFASSNPSFLSENHHNQRAISSLMHISPKASSDWDSEYSFNQTYTKKQIVTAIAGGSSAIGLLLKKSKIPDLLYAPLLAMITAFGANSITGDVQIKSSLKVKWIKFPTKAKQEMAWKITMGSKVLTEGKDTDIVEVDPNTD